MGIFTVWDDDAARKLKKTDATASSAWKYSNLFLKFFLLSFVPVVFFLLIAVLVPLLLSSLVATPGGSLERTPSGIVKNVNMLSESITGVFPVLALVCLIIAGFFATLYVVGVTIVAYRLKDIPWAVAILVLSVPAPIYKYKKGKKIREKGFSLKQPK
ncbi:MAG: hypothetical protein V1909_06255 [Candidatus Micrarchaeota archaeon]